MFFFSEHGLFYSNHTWMYDRCYTGRGCLKEVL